jgi:hypothetical protein
MCDDLRPVIAACVAGEPLLSLQERSTSSPRLWAGEVRRCVVECFGLRWLSFGDARRGDPIYAQELQSR